MRIVKSRNRFLAPALWSGFACVILFWLVLRRAGFNTSYSRCYYLVMLGDYKQLLEAGTFPMNVHLPPHLRLDKLSYLDLPETELAVSPVIDLSLSDRDNIQGLERQLPSSERSDIHVHFGPIKTQTVVMTSHANERYVRRRLGISDEDRKKLKDEEHAKVKRVLEEREKEEEGGGMKINEKS